MFNHHHAVAGTDQPVQDLNEFFDVSHVQTHGWLVQHVQRVRRFLAAPRDVVAHFAELGDEFHALCLAARQRGRRLTQREVAQAHVLEQLQRMRDVGHGSKKLNCFVDLHAQHFTDAFAAPGDGQCFRVEARAVAAFTKHFDIRQKTHTDGAHARALAGRAATFAGVE